MQTPIEWADLWPMLAECDPRVRRGVMGQLDLPAWIVTRSPGVAAEVLESAPEDVIAYFWPRLHWRARRLILKSQGFSAAEARQLASPRLLLPTNSNNPVPVSGERVW